MFWHGKVTSGQLLRELAYDLFDIPVVLLLVCIIRTLAANKISIAAISNKPPKKIKRN